MATKSLTPLACLAALLCVGAASAQGKFDLTLSGGSFGHDEYGGFSLGYQQMPSLRFVLRANSTPFHTFDGNGFSLTYGGKDLEGMAYYRAHGTAHEEIGVGVSVADTPARDRTAMGTFDLGWWTEDRQSRQLRIGFRGLVAPDSLAMFSLRGTTPIRGPDWVLVGEFGVTAWGANTLSTRDGRSINETIEKVGLQFNPGDRLHFEADLTNQLGETTGYSMTPSLGNRFGFRLSVGVRF